jgi:hypothetical protein
MPDDVCRVTLPLQMTVLVPTSLVMHNFWDFASSSPAHQIEFMNFIKVSRLAEAGCPQTGC